MSFYQSGPPDGAPDGLQRAARLLAGDPEEGRLERRRPRSSATSCSRSSSARPPSAATSFTSPTAATSRNLGVLRADPPPMPVHRRGSTPARTATPPTINLSIMIRLCRIDFGVRIRVDTRPLEMTGPDRLTRAHVVIGRIQYDDVDQGEMPGVLVYVKDLTDRRRAARPPEVRQEVAPPSPTSRPTSARSFDEEQFECYRSLGDHIARVVFADAVDRLGRRRSPGRGRPVEATRRVRPRLSSPRCSPAGARRPDPTTARLMALGPRLGRAPRRVSSARPALAEPEPAALPRASGAHRAGGRRRPRAGRGPRGQPDARVSRRSLDLARPAGASRPSRDPGLAEHLPPMDLDPGDPQVLADGPLGVPLGLCPVLRVRAAPDDREAGDDSRCPALAPTGASFEGLALARLTAEFAIEWPGEVLAGRGLNRAARPGRGTPPSFPFCRSSPAWLIVQAPVGRDPRPTSRARSRSPGSSWRRRRRPTADRPTPTLEFLAWVRPAYRSAGPGRADSRRGPRPPPDPRPEGGPTAERFPHSGPGTRASSTGPGTTSRVATWLSFFARFDFRRYVPPRRQ